MTAEQIDRTTEINGILVQATYKWVNGHQDKNTAYMDLHLEASTTPCGCRQICRRVLVRKREISTSGILTAEL